MEVKETVGKRERESKIERAIELYKEEEGKMHALIAGRKKSVSRRQHK